MKNRQKNRTKTLSLLLLKEKGTTVKEGRADRGRQNGGARISLSFPFNADETCPEPMRHALLDGTAPDQMGRGLAVAHHYRTINRYHTMGTGIEAPPHASGFPLPQDRPGEAKNEISAGRPTNPLSQSSHSVSTLRHR